MPTFLFTAAFSNCSALLVDVVGQDEVAAELKSIDHEVVASYLLGGPPRDISIRTPFATTFWRFGARPGDAPARDIVHEIPFDAGKKAFERVGLFSPAYSL